MRYVIIFILSAIFTAGFGFFGDLAGAADVKAPGLKELRVRVYSEGKPVPDLKKENFSLYEDKNLRTITRFGITGRKIGNPSGTSSPPRCFVLLFDISEYSSPTQKGLSYVLDHLLASGDQLLIAANGQTLFFSDLAQKERTQAEIDKFLEVQSKQAGQRMIAELASIEKAMDLIRTRSARETERHGQGAVHLHYYMKYIKFSLERYIDALKAYKNRYMTMDVDNYDYLLKPLESVSREKWMIRFCQLPIIPKLSGKNRTMLKNLIKDLGDSTWGDELYYSELFTKMLAEIDDLFNSAAEFPVEDMGRLFHRLDAVFHSLILADGPVKISKDHKQQRLLADIETALAEIAQRSGGTAAALLSPAADRQIPLETALDGIRDTEDICYTLAYSPQNPGNPGKLHVEADNKNYRVFVNDAAESKNIGPTIDKGQDSPTPGPQFKDLSFKNKTLSFTIAGFLLQKTGKGETGQIAARIYIVDIQNNKILFDQNKLLQPQKDSIHISLNFSWLPKGSYEVGVGANDLLTGKRATSAVPGSVL